MEYFASHISMNIGQCFSFLFLLSSLTGVKNMDVTESSMHRGCSWRLFSTISSNLEGGFLSPFLACDFYNTFSFFHLQCFAEGMGTIASSLTSISLVLSNNFSQQVSNAL
ncbi:hypothetical protein CY35_10G086000 [Sphagnum magellanicum]|nr:hypothetical protein CY35_10G086000 [Sphagnum magellanicum]